MMSILTSFTAKYWPTSDDEEMKMKYLATALLISASLAQEADMSFDEVRVRAVPPGANISAVFMNVKNNTSTDLAIVSVDSSVADSVELHNNSTEDGKMKMRRIDQIKLNANSEIKLKPGGLHIMLIGLKRPLVEGDKIDLRVNLSDATSQSLEVPVVNIRPTMNKMTH